MSKKTTQDFKVNTLIPDMPNEAYHGVKGTFSSSQLKDILEDPELFHAKYIARTMPKEESTAFDVGTYFHTAILEPHKLTIDCAVFEGIRRGKAWDEFQEVNKGKAIITKSEFKTAETIVQAVKNSPVAMNYINSGKSEVSAFVELFVEGGNIYSSGKVLGKDGWENTDYVPSEFAVKLIVKGRADCLGEDFILDLKSTTGNCKVQSATKKKIAQYQYDLSAAFYLDLFSIVLGKQMKTFIWTFASKDMGNCKNWAASSEVIKVGRAKWKKAIIEIARNISNDWQFEDTLDIVETNYFDKEWLEEKEEDLL